MNTATVRAHVLSNAVESLSALNGVEAIYLSGSLAEGSEDEHSDIDLRIVVSDEHFETVRAARAKYPTTWGGPFLFHQTVAGHAYRVLLRELDQGGCLLLSMERCARVAVVQSRHSHSFGPHRPD